MNPFEAYQRFVTNGPKRRQWLDEQDRKFTNAIRHYLGPTGIPDKLEAVGSLLEFSDAGDVKEAADSSRALWNDPSLGNAARYATAGAALAVPFVGAKMVNEGVDIAGSAADDIRRYLGEEDGGIRVWHGSPHDFDKFSMDKIGTGEGAQAYGHGLYFAENKGTASSYRDALAPGMSDGALRAAGVSDADLRSMRQFTQSAVDPDVALRDWLGWTGKAETPEIRAAFMSEWQGRNPGRLYEVDINANPEDFLDWDAPLSEQPEKVRGVLEGFGLRADPEGQRAYDDALLEALNSPTIGSDALNSLPPHIPDPSGQDIYRKYGGGLREAGIPGIRYYDQGSRTAGEGTRNYVVFDDEIISIINKYGLAAALFGGALARDEDSPIRGYAQQ